MDKSNREFARKLEKRTKDFALMIINIAFQLPNNAVSNIIRYQVIKSETSIGANYREANRSVSLADFENKSSELLALFTSIARKRK